MKTEKKSKDEYYLCNKDLKMPYVASMAFIKGRKYKRISAFNTVALVNEFRMPHFLGEWLKHFTKI